MSGKHGLTTQRRIGLYHYFLGVFEEGLPLYINIYVYIYYHGTIIRTGITGKRIVL